MTSEKNLETSKNSEISPGWLQKPGLLRINHPALIMLL